MFGWWWVMAAWAGECEPYALAEATTAARGAFLDNDYAGTEALIAKAEAGFACLDPATDGPAVATLYQAAARVAFAAGQADKARLWLRDALVLSPELLCPTKWGVDMCALQTEVGAELSNADLVEIEVVGAVRLDGESYRAGQEAEVLPGPHLVVETAADGTVTTRVVQLAAGASLGTPTSKGTPKATAPKTSTTTTSKAEAPKERNVRPVLFVTGGVLTAVGVGTLGLAAVSWNALAADYAEACDGKGFTAQECVDRNPEFAEHINTITLLDVAGGVASAAGIGLIVGGFAVQVDHHGLWLHGSF